MPSAPRIAQARGGKAKFVDVYPGPWGLEDTSLIYSLTPGNHWRGAGRRALASVDHGDFRPIVASDRLVRDAKDQNRAVVLELTFARRVFIGHAQNLPGDRCRRGVARKIEDSSGEPFHAELLFFGVFRFVNSVRGQNHNVAWAEQQGDFLILRLGEQSERDAFDAHDFRDAVADQERPGRTGIGEGEQTGVGVIDG